MSNYKEMYFTLFAGMSNLVELNQGNTDEARALRRAMIELMQHCEELYLEGE